MHSSPALVPRLAALARASPKPPVLRLALEHVETHAAARTAPAHVPATPAHPIHPAPLSHSHGHGLHGVRQPRKFLFFTTLNRRTEPLPAPMVQWNDHLSMV